MSDKLYNILKKACTIIIPASCSLYWGLSGIWGWPYAEQIVGTGSVICTFIGAIIGISTKNFWDGKQIIDLQRGKTEVVEEPEDGDLGNG